MIRALLLIGLLLALCASSATAIDWWYDFECNHPSTYKDVPSDVKNAAGGNAFVLKSYTSTTYGWDWPDLGGGNTGWRLYKNDFGKIYWDGDDSGYQAYDPNGGALGWTFEARMKIDSVTVDTSQNQGLCWYLGYQKLGSASHSAKARLNMGDRPSYPNSQWGDPHPDYFYIHDNDFYANFAVRKSTWFTLRYAEWFDGSVVQIRTWLDGVLVQTQTRTGLYTSDYYFGYNDRKNCTADVTWDYIRWTAQGAYDPEGNLIPEPGSLLALSSGLIGAIAALRRSRR